MKCPRGTAAVKEESYLKGHCENGKVDMMLTLEPENLPNDISDTRRLEIRKPRLLHNPTDDGKV